jgi:hypothetical protein
VRRAHVRRPALKQGSAPHHQRVTGEKKKLMLLNRSITVQFTLVFVVALLLVIGSFYLVLDNVYRTELKSQAETTSTRSEAGFRNTAGCG